MIKSCVFYSAIIVLFDSAFADPDLTLIFESEQKDTYNASCVIGGKALKEPIYWTQNKGQPVTSRSSPRYVPKHYQMNFDGNETDYVWKQWNISDESTMKLFGPVIDERWEMFQTEKLTKTRNLWTGQNFVSVSVSVFISNMDYKVQIGNNYHVQVNSSFSSVVETKTLEIMHFVQLINPDEVWLHFAITKIENEMKLTFFPNKEQITWSISKTESPSFISISKGIKNINAETFGFLKLHKYKYLYSEDPFENAHEIIGHSHKGELCIVMFVAVCDSCSLNLILSVDDETVNGTSITAEKNQKGHYLWRRIEIKKNITVNKNIQMFAQKINPKGTSSFWAIDDIRFCDSSEVRIVSINTSSNTNISCHSLADTKFSVSGSEGNAINLTCDTGQLGESCKISCQSIFQRKDYCGNIICINSRCSCSWGFYGKNCNEGCDNNFWGKDCKNKCGKCENNEVCNRFNGACKDCQKPYTGAKCTGSLPVLYSKPIVIGNPSYTSIKIDIEKNYTGSYLPIEILIQYRKQSEKKWKTYSTCTTKYEDFHICDINNLTSSTVYEIRAILVAKEGSLHGDGDTPILYTTTTCKDITADTFHIKPNKTSAQVIFNLKDPTLCKLNTYTMQLLWSNHSRDITETGILSSISDLLPYTEYRISFCNKSTNLCNTGKSFRTKPARPGKVSNVTSDSSSNEISLAWSAPPKSGKTIDYNVTYKLYRHEACSSNITQVLLLTESVNKTQIVLQNLIAYSNYEIYIQATNEAGHGDIVKQTVATKESDDLHDVLPTNVTVIHGEIQITPPSCEQVKGPLQYTINYTYNDSQLCVNGENVSVDVNYETGIMKLDHSDKLKPYSQYLVTVLARRNKSSYSLYGQKYQYTTKPSRPPKVTHLMVYSKNESHVWLRWIVPCPSNGKLGEHLIKVTPTMQEPFNTTVARRKSTCFWGKEYECAVIKNLTQNQSYRFEVQAKNRNVGDYGEAAIIEKVITREEKSEPPNNLTYQFEANELSLKWIHPDVTNGPLRQFNIDGYIVETALENEAQNISDKYLVERDQLQYKKKLNATPATVYNISVVAINSKMGEHALIEVTIPPPEPELSSPPFITSCLEGTCSINISSVSNCINCSAYLVVSYKANENTKSPFKETPFYEKISKNEENTKILQSQHWIVANISSLENIKNINIGKAMGGEPVYNDGNSLMHIILISYYKGKYNTKTYNLDYGIEELEGKFNNLYFLLLLLVIPLAVLSFFIYRFCQNNKVETKTEERSINANLPLVKNAERITEDAFPLMTLPPLLLPKPNILKETKHKYSKVIELSNFKSYLKKAAEGDATHNQLTKQHEMCKGGYNKPVQIGLMEINKKKNRYRDLVAYDHTRVKLKCVDENGSDYINANYIHGYNTKKAYIATQGPKANTVNDFWHMIWEQDVGNIIMLANVIENGKKKCEEYWPALNQTMKFQDISIQNSKTNIFSSYIYREFEVTCKGNKRTISHLHFTLWPDHGVPLYPQNLVPFMKEMLKIPQGTHPIVVHCSAGIGRTGTILLCDIVLRMAALEHKVDFLKIYHQLREQRPNMVDNPAQYILAHLVVYECLFGKDFSIPLDGNFKNSIENLLTEASIKSMMDYLEEVSWQIKIMQEYFCNELSDMNKGKNRFSTILPGCSQVYLERYPEDDESSDYINAVSMNCFQHQDRFLVTQQPLPNTVGDFWRLILQYDVNTIVSLNEIRRKDKTSCIFWPKRNQSFYPVDYIKVAHQNEEDRGDFNVITVVITDEYENKKRFISLICLNGWMPDTSTPADPSGILAVRNYMFNTTFGHDNFIVVTCYDGTKASGLFVALSFLIEKMKLEHTCDVMLAVSTVRERRMQCFRDKEQFKFLLKAALLYFESFEMYSNFDNL